MTSSIPSHERPADDAANADADASIPVSASDNVGRSDDATGNAADDNQILEQAGSRKQRERAQRRAVSARARAIEQARREAKRRVQNEQEHHQHISVRWPQRTVRGLSVVIWVVVLVIGAAGLGLVLYFTPLMSVRNITISGIADTSADGGGNAINEISRAEVVDAMQVAINTPLLQVDTKQVADRVANIRRVASVRVQRQYPSTLHVTIVARVAVVVQDFPDGPHLFDRDGVDFATAMPPEGLPYLDVANPSPVDPPTMAALEVMTALRPEVVAQVSRIAAPSVSSMTLTLVDGRSVVWGTAERTGEKAEKLAALLTQPGQVYDISSPDLPTVK